jgi:hypothetical protein
VTTSTPRVWHLHRVAHAAWVLHTSADWWLKLDLARHHNRELAGILDEFRTRNPYTLEPEPTSNPTGSHTASVSTRRRQAMQ